MERSTLPNPGGIADLGPDDRLVVDFLHHNHQDGSVHWVLEFSGSRPGVVLVKTAGRRVVRKQRLVEVSPDDLARIDQVFREKEQWQPGKASYCDVRLRRFHGAELVSEETRLGVMPGPEEGCELLMRLCRSVPRTRQVTGSGTQLSMALWTALVTVLLAPVLLMSVLGRALSRPGGLVRSRQAS